MPIHDWTRVEAGIFHAFHHRWISAISDALNSGLPPRDYYALPEQVAAGFGPDVLTLQDHSSQPESEESRGSVRLLQPRPKATITAETAKEFYRRKKSSIAIRHVSGDRLIAFIEIISPGQTFVEKACDLLEHRIHLLIVDLFPPGPRDRPLTLASYECERVIRAYVEPVAVGDLQPDMPLFLEENGCIKVPLENTYATAFNLLPRRWRDVLEPPAH